MSVEFQKTCDRALDQVGTAVWDRMSARERVDAIYREMRAQDVENTARHAVQDAAAIAARH